MSAGSPPSSDLYAIFWTIRYLWPSWKKNCPPTWETPTTQFGEIATPHPASLKRPSLSEPIMPTDLKSDVGLSGKTAKALGAVRNAIRVSSLGERVMNNQVSDYLPFTTYI